MDRFGDNTEAAYGIFDGDRNEEVPRLLQCTMGDVLSEEIQHSGVDSVYMCNTFLTSHRYGYSAPCTHACQCDPTHSTLRITEGAASPPVSRKLGMAGQKLGASALLCYIHHEASDPGGYFSLTLANVGTCQALLCRDRRPLVLSKVFSLEQSAEETDRVKRSKAIITEVGA